jgi:hypothetical protein
VRALGGAVPFGKNRTFESDFLNGLDACTIMALRSQQTFPAIGQAQPKLPIVLVCSLRSKASALLGLVLEEVAGFEHSHHHNKSPAYRGSTEGQTRRHGIGSDRARLNSLALPDFHRLQPTFTFN